MLGWLLLGALFSVAAIAIYVSYLDEKIAQEKLKENSIKKATIKDICTSDGVTHIKLDAIDTDGNDKEVDIEVDSYDKTEFYKGKTIIVA